jgi:cytochrome c553
MKKTAQLCVLSLLAFLMAGVSVSAQDGERLYVYKFCTTCHGQKGISHAPNYPNLAKQNERYLVNQVKDIIAKKRANKLTLLMTEHPIVTSVSDEEIAAIAAHLTTIKQGP